MRSYGQYCPVAQALELIGDRWTLLIIRDMLTGTMHFNEIIRGLPGLSRALLAKRLKQLEIAGIVEKQSVDDGRQTTAYTLTEAGQDLREVINALLVWGTTWSFGDPREEDLDPLLLMWWIRNRVQFENLPDDRITIQFDFYAPRCDSYWLVMTKDDVELCVTSPGFEVNVMVSADLRTFFKVWLGKQNYTEAVQEDQINLEGSPKWTQAFPDWFAWSAAAPAVRTIPSRMAQ